MTKRLAKANGRTVRRAAVVGGLVLILALFLGACENPTGGNNNTAQDAADTFKSSQSGVLNKTTDTVTLNDEAAVNAALAAYEELSAGAKELLTAEKAKLDGLKARIEELKAAAGPEELAAAFKTGHSAVLNKTVETVAPTDEEAVEAALTAYAALNAGTKELLTAEKTKLDALKTKIGELKAVANAVTAFKADHAVVLGKTVTTVTRGDEAAVNAALTAHEALSDGVKDLLTAEKATLDTLKAKIDELKLTVFATVADLQTWLGTQTANDTDHPYDLAYTGSETPVQIYDALNTADKFVALDLSAASVTGFATGTEAGRAKIVSLLLPDSLTATPESSGTSATYAIFKGFTNLKTVQAANVETIGQTNFRGLTSLTTVILPKATEIKQYAFYGCTTLTTVEVPKVQTIGASAFGNSAAFTTGFTTISLPEVTNIGNMAFAANASLTTVILGNTPPTIGGAIFLGIATSPKTVTFKVPEVAAYTAAGSPWSDKIGANNAIGYFWDVAPATQDNLTVALEPITP
jgi:hypothetical protein